jgi:pilus assembly protein FimV
MMQRKQLIPLMLALAGAVQAAELGDIAPRSYIGQPLAVDIELVSLTPEEMANLPVRLAQADVYRAANAAINPALSSVRMQVEKRGQKQILHVTTTRAVEAEYLHLYVELGVPGKSDVRLATVWLQRDPNPPPPPAPVQVAAVTPAAPPVSAMTPAQAEQIAVQARAARAAAAEVAKAEAAKVEAARVEAAKAEAAKAEAAKVELAKAEAARERAKPAPMPSVHEAETGRPGEVKAAGQARRIAGILVGSDGKPVAPSAHEEANAVPVGVSQALLPLAPLPLPKGVKRPAPASCAPTGMSAKECVALDARNTEMASKITELEDKLRALAGALGGAAPAPKPGVPTAAASPAAQAASAAAPAAAKNGASGPAGAAASGAASGAAGHAAPGSAAEKVGAKVASASASASGAAAAGGAASAGDAGGKAGDAGGKAGGKGASSALASASLSAQGETEAHAAKAAGASASASSAASGEASASAAASVPTRQVRVLPKLKYKKEKEKPAEQSSSLMLPLIGGGVGLLALLGGGFVFLRKRSVGKGPLKIWQGFRKKKTDEPTPEPAAEPTPESVA